MRVFLTLLLILCSGLSIGCSDKDASGTTTSKGQVSTLQEKIRLAKCLDVKGWTMYSSSTCSACLIQKKRFGEAFVYINEIECNPHASDSEVALCIEKEIRKTPTWVWESAGKELMRLQAYQPLEILKEKSGCDY